MKNKPAFPSKRLLLSLFFGSSSVILLQNYNLRNGNSFLANLVCLACGLGVCAVLFIPSIILKKKYNTDLSTSLRLVNPKSHLVIFAFYVGYLVYTADYFLLRYTDMFNQKYFSGAPLDLIALAMVAIAMYGAYRGVSIITRFGIFVFVFAVVCYLLIFGGSVSALDFVHYGFEFSGDLSSGIINSIFFATPAFIAVIHLCTSSKTENFKLRQPVMLFSFVAVESALVLFFTHFALGNYAGQQSYQTFLLSKISRVSGIIGIESVFFALATLCVFITVSLCLCSICSGLGESGGIKNTLIFSVIIFVLHMCAVRLDLIRELLTSPSVFFGLTLIFSAIIPTFYILICRRKLSA